MKATLAPGVPVQWEVTQGANPPRPSYAHRTSVQPGWTKCGKRIPTGARKGDDVDPEARPCSPCLNGRG